MKKITGETINGRPVLTWNPVAGCTAVSSGCFHCKAARLVRAKLGGSSKYAGLVKTRSDVETRTKSGPRGSSATLRLVESCGGFSGEVRFFFDELYVPFRTKEPSAVVVVDRGDLFHPGVSFDQVAAVFGAMAATPRHHYRVLTKRASRMREWFAWMEKLVGGPSQHAAWCLLSEERDRRGDDGPIHCQYGPDPEAPWPLPNVSLGVSAEDQQSLDLRVGDLLATPAVHRFAALEPLLGKVDLTAGKAPSGSTGHGPPGTYDYLTGRFRRTSEGAVPCESAEVEVIGQTRLDLVRVGGEVGPDARSCLVDWVWEVVKQCAEAGVPCDVRQLGSNPRSSAGEVLSGVRDPEGRDPSKWPSYLRIWYAMNKSSPTSGELLQPIG